MKNYTIELNEREMKVIIDCFYDQEDNLEKDLCYLETSSSSSCVRKSLKNNIQKYIEEIKQLRNKLYEYEYQN